MPDQFQRSTFFAFTNNGKDIRDQEWYITILDCPRLGLDHWIAPGDQPPYNSDLHFEEWALVYSERDASVTILRNDHPEGGNTYGPERYISRAGDYLDLTWGSTGPGHGAPYWNLRAVGIFHGHSVDVQLVRVGADEGR